MNKKLILIFFVVTIVTVHIHAQPCISTVKQLDSLVAALKLNVPIKQKWGSNKEDSLNNWQDNFPVQLCKKLPLFENTKDYSHTQRLTEYWILLNFYRHSSDSAIKNYILSKMCRTKYYEIFYASASWVLHSWLFQKKVPDMLLKTMSDYTKKHIDTVVLKKILIANRIEKNKSDTLSAEDYRTDSAAYCKKIFNNSDMDYFIMGMASDLKLVQFAPWLESAIKSNSSINGNYMLALARMRYKDYYTKVMKEYLNPTVYIDADWYSRDVLYIECKECFNQWQKQLSDTTTRIVVEYENSNRAWNDTVYLTKYIDECLFSIFLVKNWSKDYTWFFWPTPSVKGILLPLDKSMRLPYNRDKLQKFINEGYPFYVSRHYYRYIK